MVKYDGKDRMVSEDPFWKEVLGKRCHFCYNIINAADVAGAITFHDHKDAPFLYKLYQTKRMDVQVINESDPEPEPKPLQYVNDGNVYCHSWCLPDDLWERVHSE